MCEQDILWPSFFNLLSKAGGAALHLQNSSSWNTSPQPTIFCSFLLFDSRCAFTAENLRQMIPIACDGWVISLIDMGDAVLFLEYLGFFKSISGIFMSRIAHPVTATVKLLSGSSPFMIPLQQDL